MKILVSFYLLNLAIPVIFGVEETCGRTQHPLGLIHCGPEARSGDYPWLVGIFSVKKNEFLCNGHLISKRHVITSERCVSEALNESETVHDSQIYIIAGQNELHSSQNENQKLKVKIVHQLIDSFKALQQCNILLMTLEVPLSFSKTVQPICLLTEKYPLKQFATMVGWVQDGTKNISYMKPKQSEIQTLQFYAEKKFIFGSTKVQTCKNHRQVNSGDVC